MSILIALLGTGVALAFALVGGLTLWGGYLALRDEIRRSFIITRPTPAARARDLLLFAGPLLGVAALSLLAAGKILLVALGV